MTEQRSLASQFAEMFTEGWQAGVNEAMAEVCAAYREVAARDGSASALWFAIADRVRAIETKRGLGATP